MIRAAVLGQDVSRSRSPEIHRAAFAALGVVGRYDAISVGTRDFRKTVRRLVRERYDYLNVTIPHKHQAASLADHASLAVKITGAANTLVIGREVRRGARKSPRIFADNTDGAGLLDALAGAGAHIRRGTVVVMVGAGGAAAGAALALVKAGARVRLLARRRAPAQALIRRLPAALRGRISVGLFGIETLATALDGAAILVSAVPADAWRSENARAGLKTLSRSTAVLEMAYGARTPLSRAVRRRAARYQDGLPMLVHQAAHAIAIALGTKPPVESLFRAVASARR